MSEISNSTSEPEGFTVQQAIAAFIVLFPEKILDQQTSIHRDPSESEEIKTERGHTREHQE
jgi:hypothetical protein